MPSLKNFLHNRKRSKLYKQWVQQSRLPEEEIPAESNKPRESDSGQFESVDYENVNVPYLPRSGMISIRFKSLVLLILLIIVLLVALSVVTTLLITHYYC